MSEKTIYSSFSLKLIATFCLLLVAFTNESFAQEEQEKVETETEIQDPILNYGSLDGDFGSSDQIIAPAKKNSSPSRVAAKPQNSKGLISEKKTKKEESSTLSFNLFLYIVDKFKAD